MMPEQTETMPHAEALLWLAGLTKTCECGGEGCEGCSGQGVRYVLDLRLPCPCATKLIDFRCQFCLEAVRHAARIEGALDSSIHSSDCTPCQGRNWLPKQGRDALHEAMHKDGWSSTITETPQSGRHVIFYKGLWVGSDVDDWLAAVKAMKQGEQDVKPE